MRFSTYLATAILACTASVAARASAQPQPDGSLAAFMHVSAVHGTEDGIVARSIDDDDLLDRHLVRMLARRAAAPIGEPLKIKIPEHKNTGGSRTEGNRSPQQPGVDRPSLHIPEQQHRDGPMAPTQEQPSDRFPRPQLRPINTNLNNRLQAPVVDSGYVTGEQSPDRTEAFRGRPWKA